MGVISDTHGLLRPEAMRALDGCVQIIHAGDVGKSEVLDELARLAPTVAVRGNVDNSAWGETLPFDQVLTVDGVVIYVLHDLHDLHVDPVSAGIRVVISGHSHRPFVEEKAGVLYLNPGSAGPRRFSLPITVARLVIDPHGSVSAEIIDILSDASRRL